MTTTAPTWSVLASLPRFQRLGRVTRVTDIGVESTGPRAALGDVCEIRTGSSPVQAEVVALRDNTLVLMPYGPCKGLTVGCEVVALDIQPQVTVSDALLGQVVDGFGVPLQSSDWAPNGTEMPLHPPAVNPMSRAAVTVRMPTGVRAIDALLPLGRGQRMGIFAGSGVGKSSLLGMLARNIEADVVVVAMIGERGREVQEFVDQRRSDGSLARTVIVVATAEQPAVVRARAAYTATSVAEYFRGQGRHVLMLMDSVTRFAMARREIDLAAGQPPTARGYTPSVFSAIPALCERCGALRDAGSITALYTVLVEGDDVNEPVSDALRATLDGHIVLSRHLAEESHYPAIDVLQSVSRLESVLLSAKDMGRAQQLRRLLAAHRRQREMVDMGLYKPGTNADLDAALANWPAINAFLRQRPADRSDQAETEQLLSAALKGLNQA
jgi:flagellum-specific ATP synthase